MIFLLSVARGWCLVLRGRDCFDWFISGAGSDRKGFDLYDLMHSSTAVVCIVLRCCDMDSCVRGSVLLLLILIVFPVQLLNMVCFFFWNQGSVEWDHAREVWGALCLSWDAWSLRWLVTDSVLVSVCRCCVLVSSVQPVMILRALFWVICSLWRLVSDTTGDHIVLAYLMTGRIMFCKWLGVSLLFAPWSECECLEDSDGRICFFFDDSDI